MQRFQSKILRAIGNAPRYIINHILHTDFNISYVSDVVHERIIKNHNNLEAHPNPLLEPLIQPINTRRLKSCWTCTCKAPKVTSMDEIPQYVNVTRGILCIIITLDYRLYYF